MGNFKVKTDSKTYDQVESLLLENGFRISTPTGKDWVIGELGGIISSYSDWRGEPPEWFFAIKEITLPELRAMVKPSLNDQYAEIEQVRQAIKVPDGSDSNHALDAMSFGLMGAGAAQFAKDNVSQPSHYTQGKVECIDALESATIGKSGIEAVCVANVIKYLWRYEEKNGLEDVKKAQWYLERLVASMGS